MLAIVGYITPELIGMLPGYLSPTVGLKFEDIPNGLGGIPRVLAGGWRHIVACRTFGELSPCQSPYTVAAAGDSGWES